MATNINNQTSLGKFGDLLFTRQTPFVGAEKHKGFMASIAAWRERSAAKAELSSLSDRELSDIGVNRQDISAVVKDGVK